MPTDEPNAPARRRFLGRAAALVGAWAAGSGPIPAARAGTGSPATTVPSDAGRDVFGHHLPDLSDEGPHSGAIQASIDRAAEGGGGVVLLPAAELVLDESLRLASHVTLRGLSIHGTRLRASGDLDGPLVVVPPDAEGAAAETLTLDGRGRPQSDGLHCAGPVRYFVVRRVRIREVGGHGLVFADGPLAHIFVEQVTIEGCGADGLRLDASDCTSVFLSEISVTDFGRATDAAHALRLSGRVHVSQVHIDPVRRRQVGIGFAPGSDLSTLTNFFIRTDGGIAQQVAPSLRIAVGEGAIQ